MGHPRQSRKASPRSVFAASLVGTSIEWYDYYIFGTATALVLNSQFFPALDPVSATLASFATFSVAFIARPLGGALFGHFGDRVGRKKMLVYSLLGMGLATLVVGFLPTYSQIGVLAPILLVACRFVQGLAVGGEWSGGVLMAMEHAPPAKRAFYASWPQAGVPAGTVLSSGAFFLVQLVPGSPAGAILGTNATAEQLAALEHELGLVQQPLLAGRQRSARDLGDGAAAPRGLQELEPK